MSRYRGTGMQALKTQDQWLIEVVMMYCLMLQKQG